MIVIGIDPGKHGAFAVVDNGKCIAINDLPYTNKDLNIKNLFDIFSDYCPTAIIIEKQHSVRGQGVRSIFSTGYGYGILKAIAVLVCDNLIEVAAKTWQKHFRDNSGTGWSKEDSVSYCIGMLGLDKKKFYGPRNGIKDGRADAVLIAFYGWSLVSKQ